MADRGHRGLPRSVNAALAGAGLLVTGPLILLLALLVRVTSPGSSFFRQRRAGRGGCPFDLVKLRTMTTGAQGAAVTSQGDRRVTPLGRLLRRTKLDELPQLWNVLRGDMALVGPRPEVPAFVDAADPLWQEVLAVRPGLTDAVTLRLRDEEALLASAGDDPETFYRSHLLPWKLRGAVAYERQRTVWSDLVVLARTLLAVALPSRQAPPSVEDIVGLGPLSPRSGRDKEARAREGVLGPKGSNGEAISFRRWR